VTDGREQGIALVIVMLLIVWLTALGSAMTMAAMTETAIAANYREATETLYAADAAVGFVMQELASVADWRDAVSEPGGSAFTDGPPAGMRMVGPFELDLTDATAEADALAAAPPGAVASPSVLYAFGRFRDLAPFVSNRSTTYVVVWVADRSAAPRDDTSAPDRLSVLGQAYGLRGSRRAVEALIEKTDTSRPQVIAWREVW
jgi:hypothetical protein